MLSPGIESAGMVTIRVRHLTLPFGRKFCLSLLIPRFRNLRLTCSRARS